PAESGRRIVRRLTASPPRRVAGLRVTGTDLLDGLKLLLGDDGWLLFRPSGTEPVLRLYCEAPTIRMVTAVLRHAVRLART
ncbi:MAG TPA: phosphoglucomutase/phosphomannomutase family protein, partial [Candidatus Polarisedimenticolia bacterium]|nr:phosphoglucomutase/phosphomannomutase family protein [Candidatus Polarisedimenticolia bacterium]